MLNRNIDKKSGFTMIEIVVAAFIFAIIAVGLLQTWSHITYNQALSTAKGQAKSDVEIASRRLIRDIAMARAGTIAGSSGSDGIEMTISVTDDSGSVSEKDVSYVRAGKTLTRESGLEKSVLSDFLMEGIKGFSWSREANASGVIYLTLGVEYPVKGDPKNLQTYSQEFIVTVREEAAGSGIDERWKQSEQILDSW